MTVKTEYEKVKCMKQVMRRLMQKPALVRMSPVGIFGSRGVNCVVLVVVVSDQDTPLADAMVESQMPGDQET